MDDVPRSTLRRALAIAGALDVTLTGSSLLPLVRSGARARIVPCRPDETRRYDLVVVEHETGLVAHVVVGRDAHGVRTAPLGSRRPDPAWGRDAIFARVEGLVVDRTPLRRVPRGLARVVVGGLHRLLAAVLAQEN